ncbi:MAG: hypothetical protein RLO21_18940 [Nitratireductor sp.]
MNENLESGDWLSIVAEGAPWAAAIVLIIGGLFRYVIPAYLDYRAKDNASRREYEIRMRQLEMRQVAAKPDEDDLFGRENTKHGGDE